MRARDASFLFLVVEREAERRRRSKTFFFDAAWKGKKLSIRDTLTKNPSLNQLTGRATARLTAVLKDVSTLVGRRDCGGKVFFGEGGKDKEGGERISGQRLERVGRLFSFKPNKTKKTKEEISSSRVVAGLFAPVLFADA